LYLILNKKVFAGLFVSLALDRQTNWISDISENTWTLAKNICQNNSISSGVHISVLEKISTGRIGIELDPYWSNPSLSSLQPNFDQTPTSDFFFWSNMV
jgi:hypothetical protein